MDQQYRPIYQQAVDLRNRFHDLTDQPNHPMAHVLQREVHELVEDMEKNKNPRTLENRVKAIQHQLLESRMQGDNILSDNHIDYFHHNYEQMRTNIRHFPHY
jgi:hypothetical protein